MRRPCDGISVRFASVHTLAAGDSRSQDARALIEAQTRRHLHFALRREGAPSPVQAFTAAGRWHAEYLDTETSTVEMYAYQVTVTVKDQAIHDRLCATCKVPAQQVAS